MVSVDEREWMTSKNPNAMLRHLTHQTVQARGMPAGNDIGPVEIPRKPPLISPRKLRLFAVAWWRSILPHDAEQEKVAREIEESGAWTGRASGETWTADDLLRDCQSMIGTAPAVGAALFREVVGNPWRPVTLPPCNRCNGDGKAHGSDRPFEWSGPGTWPGPCPVCRGVGHKFATTVVVGLAEAAYDRRLDGSLDPLTLLALADALEEAGCEKEELLGHLRVGPSKEHSPRCGTEFRGCAPECPKDRWERNGPHHAGCWAVDCVLGMC